VQEPEKRMDPLERQKAKEKVDFAERRRLKEIKIAKMTEDF